MRKSEAYGKRRLPGFWRILSRRFWRGWFDWQERMEWRLDAAEQKLRHLGGHIRVVEERLNKLEVEVDGLTSAGPLSELFQEGIGREWTIFTGAGSLNGVVLAAGTDFVLIREAAGDEVYIPYAQIEAVSPPATEGGGRP
ncbi:hypothetical protein [Gorillibacterium sp. sgz500922]|uniref:hypothetical protein n=1 Tax=Gorillibacterium sp. sgz500922 TaxID=3446694 RepID=UPI003F66ED15